MSLSYTGIDTDECMEKFVNVVVAHGINDIVCSQDADSGREGTLAERSEVE